MTFTGNLKTNLRRISLKIDEFIKDHGRGLKDVSKFAITDMIRGRVNVKSLKEMCEVYDFLLKIKEITVVRVTN